MNRYPRTYAGGHLRSRSRLRATMAEQTSSAPAPAPAATAASCPTQPLAFPYVPAQPWGDIYAPEEGWRRGTIFPALDMPYEEGGARQ